jgi:hypothetical protein
MTFAEGARTRVVQTLQENGRRLARTRSRAYPSSNGTPGPAESWGFRFWKPITPRLSSYRWKPGLAGAPAAQRGDVENAGQGAGGSQGF